MAHRYQGQYVTPDSALKQAEQFVAEGSWQSAVQILNAALQNRRIRGNNSMLERIMVSIFTMASFYLNAAILFAFILTRQFFVDEIDRHLRG